MEQSVLQVATEQSKYGQARARRIPSLSMYSTAGMQLGRSIDPTTNTYTTRQVAYQTYALQSSVLLFNWHGLNNTIRASMYNYNAARYTAKDMQRNLWIETAATYLALLHAKSMQRISQEAILITSRQIGVTDTLVKYGKAIRTSSIRLRTQLTGDSVMYLKSGHSLTQIKAEMCQLMGMPVDTVFDIRDSLTGGERYFAFLRQANPAEITEHALRNDPGQIADKLQEQSLAYTVRSARAGMFPSLSMGASVGSNYSNHFRSFTGDVVKYPEQLFNTNLSRNIYVSLSIPVFNQRSLATSAHNAKISLRSIGLQRKANTEELAKHIHLAYQDAWASYREYLQYNGSVADFEEAFELTRVLFEHGKASVVEFLAALNELNISRINRSNYFHDAVMKIMMLQLYARDTFEFY